MKTILLSLFTLTFTFTLFGQTTTETRTVSDFNALNVSAPITVEITQGDVNAVVLEGDAAAIKNIETEVSNNTLNIRGNASDEVKAKVTVKSLTSIETSGACEVSSINDIKTDTLTVTSSGASKSKLMVQTKKVNATLSGASEVKFTGNTDLLSANTSGASNLKAYELNATDVKITSSGASNAHVHANNSLDANAAGASNVRYDGSATSKTINVAGAGSVTARNESGNGNDTTSFTIGGYDVHLTPNGNDDERSHREKHKSDHDFEFWEGMDLGVSGFLTQDNQIDLPAANSWMNLNYAKSYVFGWNIAQKNIHIYKNFVNLGTGIGLTWYHYNFRNSISLLPNTDPLGYTMDSVNYTKNRLGTCYLNAPLFLEFNTNNSDAHNSFHIGAGFEFGYNVFSNKLKQKYEMGGHTYKNKVRDDFDVNPFKYDAMVRIGYGKFTIFGTYAMSTLFEKGKGPTVYPFTAGVHLNF